MTTTTLRIIVAGTPIDGFRFYGPYNHSEVDGDLISHLIGEDEWWIAEVAEILEAP